MATVNNKIVISATDATGAVFQKVGGKLGALSNQASGAATGIGRITSALGLLAVVTGTLGTAALPLIQYAAFEKTMSRVGAVSKASGSELERLTAQARELGASTVWSASEAAEGMTYLAMAGFNVNSTLAAMPGMLSLASAAQIDLGRAADISSNILSGFGLQASEMGRVGDVLTATFTSSNTTLEMLGTSMKYAATPAKNLGVEIETLSAMVGKLGDRGIQGEMAGTSLRSMLTKLAAPTRAARNALDQLGVKTSDAAGNMLPIVNVLASIEKASQKMGTGQKTKIFADIFGLESVNAASILAAEAAAGGLAEYAQRLKNDVGAASRVANQQTDNLSGSWVQMKSALEELSLVIGERLAPATRDLIDLFTYAVRGTADFIKENGRLISTIAHVAGGLVLAKVATVGLSAAMALAKAPMVAFMLTSSLAGGAIPAAMMLIKTAVVTSMAVIRGAIMSNPIGLLVTGLTVAASAIYANWDKIGPMFSRTMDIVVGSIKYAGGVALDILSTVFGPMLKILDKITGSNYSQQIGDMATSLKTFGDVQVDRGLGVVYNPVNQAGGVRELSRRADGLGGSRSQQQVTGAIDVRVRSDGRVDIERVQSSGGIDLSAGTGAMMVAP